jgi:cobalamin biosynthesis Mg chelatase CobN
LPQGVLKLDKPFPPPSYSEITFPFCKQYQQCSCCNASHVVALERSLQTYDTEPLSSSCQAMTAQLACRICDPEVGTGQKQQVCASTCQKWYSRCQHDYFSYSTLSQHLVPCGTRQASAVCSTAHELADNAQSFCQQAGYDIQDTEPADADAACFDGTLPPTSQYSSCAVRTQRTQNQSKSGSSISVLYICFVLSALVALLLIGRRIASVIMKQLANAPAPPPTRHSESFPGKSRRLRE